MSSASAGSDNNNGEENKKEEEEQEQQQSLPQEEEEVATTTLPEVSTTTTPTTTPPPESNFAEQFEKMLQKYGEDYMRRVVEMAKQDQFTIVLQKPTGKKEPDPLEPDKERDVYNGTEKKVYRRHPIGTGDYHRAEKLRAQFANERDPDKVADNQARIYQFLAFCYLKMPYSEFIRVEDWTQLKLIVDACNHKTLYQPG